MVEVLIDSVRVSLMQQTRLVVLKEIDSERYLAIWIGPDTAEAITMQLQNVSVARPMTHDLLKNTIQSMGGKISHIVINDLRNDIYYAQIILDVNGTSLEIDSRPSDALALAVRANAKIFVGDQVMEEAAIVPEVGLDVDAGSAGAGSDDPEDLEAFRDFVDSLDLDDL